MSAIQLTKHWKVIIIENGITIIVELDTCEKKIKFTKISGSNKDHH